MFDIGFSEMIMIAVVALVVIGPERLPRVARTAGHLLGRLQRYVNDVKADINREMQIEELKRLQAEIQESARRVESDLRSSVEQAREAARAVSDELRAASTASVAPPPATPGVQPTHVDGSQSAAALPPAEAGVLPAAAGLAEALPKPEASGSQRATG